MQRIVRVRSRSFVLVATVGWLGLLFYLLGAVPWLPQISDLASGPALPLGHYATHLVLGALVYWLVRPASGSPRGRLGAFTMAIGANLAIAVLLEGAQALLPERSSEATDVLFGLAGASTGAWAALLREQTDLRWALLVIAIATIFVSMTVLALGDRLSVDGSGPGLRERASTSERPSTLLLHTSGPPGWSFHRPALVTPHRCA